MNIIETSCIVRIFIGLVFATIRYAEIVVTDGNSRILNIEDHSKD